MPHPEREHELQIALATALRERDEARALAEKWAQREAAGVERGIRADADSLNEIQGLQAMVERLRGALVKYGSHVDDCNGGDFCWCGLAVDLAAANARADAAVAEIVNEQRRFGEMQSEAWKLEEALAAARRESKLFRDALEKAADGLRHGEAADLYQAYVSLPIDSWRAIRDAYHVARAALAAGGEGK